MSSWSSSNSTRNASHEPGAGGVAVAWGAGEGWRRHLRHRRGHDLRRTMISLARRDGARKDILELCTHTPRKSGNTIDLYTTFPWEALCAEVSKLKVQRHERGQLARLPLAASAEKENP